MAAKKDQGTNPISGLHRSKTNKVIAGVAGGLGEYFRIDPTIIRIFFILLFFFSGSGLLIYLVLWVVMPRSDALSSDPKDHIRDNVDDLKASAQKFAHDLRLNTSKEDSHLWLGLILIVLGFLFLLNSLGFYSGVYFAHLWPLLLIVVGLLLLTRNG